MTKCHYCDNPATKTLIWLKDEAGKPTRIPFPWCGCDLSTGVYGRVRVLGVDYEVQTEPGAMGTAPIFDDARDEGGLAAKLTLEPSTKTLKVSFGTTLSFLRMTAEQAEVFALSLYQAAQELK